MIVFGLATSNIISTGTAPTPPGAISPTASGTMSPGATASSVCSDGTTGRGVVVAIENGGSKMCVSSFGVSVSLSKSSFLSSYSSDFSKLIKSGFQTAVHINVVSGTSKFELLVFTTATCPPLGISTVTSASTVDINTFTGWVFDLHGFGVVGNISTRGTLFKGEITVDIDSTKFWIITEVKFGSAVRHGCETPSLVGTTVFVPYMNVSVVFNLKALCIKNSVSVILGLDIYLTSKNISMTCGGISEGCWDIKEYVSSLVDLSESPFLVLCVMAIVPLQMSAIGTSVTLAVQTLVRAVPDLAIFIIIGQYSFCVTFTQLSLVAIID